MADPFMVQDIESKYDIILTREDIYEASQGELWFLTDKHGDLLFLDSDDLIDSYAFPSDFQSE